MNDTTMKAAVALAKQGETALARELIAAMSNKKKITLTVNDGEGAIEKLLRYIKEISDPGHSFTIDVDPDDPDCNKKFGIDGDGADRIFEIGVEKIKE